MSILEGSVKLAGGQSRKTPTTGFAEDNSFIAPLADTMRAQFELMYNALKYPINAKKNSLDYLKGKLEKWEELLRSIEQEYKELLEKIKDLQASLEGNLDIELAKQAFNYFARMKYLRRLLGEANYWQLYNTLGLLADGAGGVVGDLLTNLKELIKYAIRYLLSLTEGFMHYESYMSLIAQSYSALYLKMIRLDKLLTESIVPNVTGAYYFKPTEPGNPYPSIENYRSLVFPVFKPEAILNGDMSNFDPKDPSTFSMLVNESEMLEAYQYWTSSYSNCNNLPNYSAYVPGVNRVIGYGPRIPYDNHNDNSNNPLKIGQTFHQLNTDLNVTYTSESSVTSLSMLTDLYYELDAVRLAFTNYHEAINRWTSNGADIELGTMIDLVNGNVTQINLTKEEVEYELNNTERFGSESSEYKKSVQALIQKYIDNGYNSETDHEVIINNINKALIECKYQNNAVDLKNDLKANSYYFSPDGSEAYLIIGIDENPYNVAYAISLFSKMSQDGDKIRTLSNLEDDLYDKIAITFITDNDFSNRILPISTSPINEIINDRIGMSVSGGRKILFPVLGVYGNLIKMDSWNWKYKLLSDFDKNYTRCESGSSIYYSNNNPLSLIYRGSSISVGQVDYVLVHEAIEVEVFTRGNDQYSYIIFPSESVTVWYDRDGVIHYDAMMNYIPRYPNSNGTNSKAWSIVDAIYELEMLVDEMEGICSDNDVRRGKLKELLGELGLYTQRDGFISQLPDGNGVSGIFRVKLFEDYALIIKRLIDSIYGFRSEILRITEDW